MAETPVPESRGGVPWWAWLAGAGAIVAIVVVALAWHFAMTPGQEEDTMGGPDVPAPTTMTIPTAIALDGGIGLVGTTVVPTRHPRSDGGITQVGTSDGGAILSDLNLFDLTPDKLSLVNRRVEFSNVRVTRVLNDRVFALTSGSGEIYAMLDHGLDRGPMEGRVTIAVGQLLDLQGAFRPSPDAEAAGREGLAVPLSAQLVTAFRVHPVYLLVTLVRGSAVR